jgi:tetratricopeptide (TPR) repeat protein
MRSSRLLVYFLVSIFAVVCHDQALGQGRVNQSGTGGVHSIQGRIYLPSGRMPEMSITIKLQNGGLDTISVETDYSGSFSFRALAPGSYMILVDAGNQYEIMREYVVIDPEVKIEGVPGRVLPKIFNVPIYLQYKKAVREALGVLNAKFANIPKEALKHYEAGMKLSQEGKSEEALKELRMAVSFYPTFSAAHTEIGKICVKLNQLTEAENAFRAALDINSQEYEAKVGFGYVLLSRKEFPDAQKELEEAKLLNQTAAAPAYYLGLLFFSQRKFPDAKSEFELTEKLKGMKDYPLVHYYLGGIYWGEKQYQKAADELEKYLSIEPNAKDADQTRKAIEQLRTKSN